MADAYSIIASYPDAGQGFASGFKDGLERQRQQRIRDAITALSSGTNPNALRSLYDADPRLGIAMEDQLYQRGERGRQADARSALADYISGGGSADTAARLDPQKFITIAGHQTKITKTELETSIKLHDAAMQLLGGVHDDASLQAAKSQAKALYQQHGDDASFIDQIPDTYSPELIHDLQMKGMNTSQQLNALARENNVESMVTTRAANTAEHVRHDQAQESDVRRGQDIRSTDTRRGQDKADDRQRRPKPATNRPPTPSTVIGGIMSKQAAGQPLTPQEQQLYNDYRSAKKRGGGSAPVHVSSVAEARALPPGTLFITPDGTVKRR